MRYRVHWRVSAGAALFFAVSYFIDSSGALSAAIPAVLVHELGHYLPLRCFGIRLRSVSISLVGVEMDYYGRLEGVPALLCILAGPAFGILYALAARAAKGEYFTMSAGISLILSFFNLLPILPLDGGRLVESLVGEHLTRVISKCTSVGAALFSLYLLAVYGAVGPAVMGAWLLLCNFGGASCIFSKNGIKYPGNFFYGERHGRQAETYSAPGSEAGTLHRRRIQRDKKG